MNDKKKLKRKLALSFVMLLLLAVMLAFSGITLAWFYKGNDQIPADTLSGSIHAAYFNGGNGSAPSENATYKRVRPIRAMNLAAAAVLTR